MLSSKVRTILLSLVLVTGLLQTTLQAQRIETGPVQKKPWYDTFIRLLKGGDGHYYLLRTGGGSYWNFRPEGERGFFVQRFDSLLRPVNQVRIALGNPKWLINNAYEVLPSPNGIAFLSSRRETSAKPYMLNICHLKFDQPGPYCDCKELFPMPGLIPGIGKPRFRVAWTPDSSHVLLTWQKLSNDDLNDNSSGAVLLNRKLEMVNDPFIPLKRLEPEVRIRKIGLTDPSHIYFHLLAFDVKGVFQNPQAMGYGLVRYDANSGELRQVRLADGFFDPMDIRILRTDEGRVMAAGWYLGRPKNENEAGVFIGEVTDADSLEGLRRYPFDSVMRRTMVFQQKRNNEVGFRRTYHNELFELPNEDLIYVMHIHGQPVGEVTLAKAGKKYDNTLLTMHFSREGALIRRRFQGFCNEARDDYRDTFSWRRVWGSGMHWAMLTEYGNGKRHGKPRTARNFLLPLHETPPDSIRRIEAPELHDGNVLAPRVSVRDRDGSYVFLAKSIKTYQLVRIRM